MPPGPGTYPLPGAAFHEPTTWSLNARRPSIDDFVDGVPMGLAGHRTDVGHDAVEDDAIDVAVLGNAGKAPVPEEAVDALIERPIGVSLLGKVGVHELPSECIDI